MLPPHSPRTLRRMRTLLAAAALLASLAAGHAAPCSGPLPPPHARIEGTVTAVTAGGAFCLATPAAHVPVTLADFAACRGEAPRLNLAKIIEAKRVACTVTRRTWTRVFARCTVEGHAVARVLRYAGTCERKR